MGSHRASNRLAFHGSLLSTHDGKTGVPLGVLAPKFYTYKSKTCTVSKVGDEYVRESDQEKVPFEVICKGLFGEGASMASFAGLKLFNGGVSTEVGVISGAFGSEGQFRVEFPGGTSLAAGGVAVLKFKKFRGDSTNKMVQVSHTQATHMPHTCHTHATHMPHIMDKGRGGVNKAARAAR